MLLSLLSAVALGQEDPKPAEPSPAKNEAAGEKPAESAPKKDEAAAETAPKASEEEDFRFEGIKIPDPPAEDYPTADYAELLDEAAEKKLHQVQLASYHEQNTPIVVVTINSMREYGPKDWSIERFGYTWFNKWQIGKRGAEGEAAGPEAEDFPGEAAPRAAGERRNGFTGGRLGIQCYRLDGCWKPDGKGFQQAPVPHDRESWRQADVL